MAAPGGSDDLDVTVSTAALSPENRYSGVERVLRETPQEFDYFQAVHLL